MYEGSDDGGGKTELFYGYDEGCVGSMPVGKLPQGRHFVRKLSNLIPAEEETEIGVWGQRHLRYLKKHRKITYINLLTSGKLNGYLADIDRQAEDMFFRLVKQMAEKQGITEQLKATDQMLWVQRMNNIRNRATYPNSDRAKIKASNITHTLEL